MKRLTNQETGGQVADVIGFILGVVIVIAAYILL